MFLNSHVIHIFASNYLYETIIYFYPIVNNLLQ